MMATAYAEYPTGARLAPLSHDEIMRLWESQQRLRHAILALEVASTLPLVAKYRDRYLADGLLLSDDDVSAWVEDQMGEAIGESVEPATYDMRTTAGGEPLRRVAGGVHKLEIECEDPRADPMAFWIPPNSASSLSDLFSVADSLASQFGWSEPSATRWLLVRGAQPSPRSIRGRIRESAARDDKGRAYHVSVMLEVPLDFPSSRLMREFEKIQRANNDRLAFDAPPGRPALDSSHRRVWFAVQRNDGRSWANLIKEWNELYPAEASAVSGPEASAFTRSIRRSYARIMDTRFVWKGTNASGE